VKRLFLVGMLVACLGRNGTDKLPKVDFSHGPLSAGWERTTVAGTIASWYHAGFGATIGVAAQCKDVEDVSLDSLAQQALIGLENREVVEQGRTPVNGREATDWVVKGSLDGVEVTIGLVTLRRGKCVYDLNLVAPPGSFEEARRDFRAFVGGFEVDSR